MIYLIFLAAWILLNIAFVRYKKTTVLIINAIYLILIAGLRSIKNGTDVQAYGRVFEVFGRLSFFDKIPQTYTGMPGYRVLCKIVYTVSGGNYQWMILVSAIIIVYGVTKFVFYYSENPIASVFYFVTLFYYFESWNTVRQWIAFSIILLSIISMGKMKYIKAFVLAIFAVSIHNIALISLLAFIITSKIKWDKKIFVIYSFILVGTMMTLNPLLELFIRIFPRYSMYAGILENGYVSGFGGGASGTAQGRRIVISLVFLMIIIFVLILQKERQLNRNIHIDADVQKRYYFWIFAALTMIEIVIGILFSKNTFFLRIQNFFSPFSIIMIPSVVERIEEKWRIPIYIGTNMLFLLATAIRLIGGEGNVYPYEFFWQI